MEHTNLRNFMYVAEFKGADGVLYYKSHNHYSCFGQFTSVTIPPRGHTFTGRFSFTTNYSSKTARRLLKLMREQNFKFIFGDKMFRMPQVTFHRANTKGSGSMHKAESLKGMHYYTVTIPLSMPVVYIYSIIKILFKVIGSTQNGPKGTRFMDTLLDAGTTFMEATSIIGLMNCSGGYRYPLVDNTWGAGYRKGDMLNLIDGYIDFKDAADVILRPGNANADRYKTPLGEYHTHRMGIPTSNIQGMPAYQRGRDEEFAQFDMKEAREYLNKYNRPRVAGDKELALNTLAYFRKQIKGA